MVLLSLRITIILIISLTSQSLQPRLLSTKQSIRIINPIKPQYTTNKRNTCGLCASKNPTDTSSSTEIDPYANFPPQLTPFAKFLDKNTGGWALSYADCTPDDETTPLGVLFLLTNVAYLVVGGFLWSKGEVTLGVLTEVAGIVSYIYHYNQLAARGNNSPAVRLSLLIDYFTAGSALVFGTGLLFEEVGNEILSNGLSITSLLSASPSLSAALISSFLAILSLGLCWVWEYGRPYLFWHSLWHVFSAATCFFVGTNWKGGN